MSVIKHVYYENINNKKPLYSIALLIIFSFITWQRFGAGLMDVGIFMYMFVIFTKIGIFKIDYINITIILQFVSVFVSSTIAYLFYSYDISIRTIISFLITSVFICYSMQYKYSRSDISKIANIFIITSLLGSVSIFINVIKGNMDGYFRYSASFFGIKRDSLYICAYQMGAFYLTINRVFNKEKTIYNFTSAFIIAAGQLFTGNRTAIVVMLFVIIYSLGLYILKKRSIFKLMITLALIITFFYLIKYLIINSLPDYTLKRLFSISNYINDESRAPMWAESFKLFIKHPIFGIGLENNNKMLVGMGLHNSHNIFLDILVGQGIVGLIVFLQYFYTVIKYSNNKSFIIGFIIASFSTLLMVNGYNTMTYWIPILLVSLTSKYDLK